MRQARARAALPSCRCCGRSGRRMVGLLTLWFGHLIGLTLRPGYFYLCPGCYAARIEPAYGALLERLGRARAEELEMRAPGEPEGRPPLMPEA